MYDFMGVYSQIRPSSVWISEVNKVNVKKSLLWTSSLVHKIFQFPYTNSNFPGSVTFSYALLYWGSHSSSVPPLYHEETSCKHISAVQLFC